MVEVRGWSRGRAPYLARQAVQSHLYTRSQGRTCDFDPMFWLAALCEFN